MNRKKYTKFQIATQIAVCARVMTKEFDSLISDYNVTEKTFVPSKEIVNWPKKLANEYTEIISRLIEEYEIEKSVIEDRFLFVLEMDTKKLEKIYNNSRFRLFFEAI